MLLKFISWFIIICLLIMVIVRLVHDAGATEVTQSRLGTTSRTLDWSVGDSITVNRSVLVIYLFYY